MNLQIATLYWELRGMPGVAATPEPLLAPQYWCSWPKLSVKWSRMVRNKNKMLYKQQLVGLGTLDCSARSIMSSIDGFRPKRSLVFASWSAGEYGSVGATEWLEVRTEYLLKGNACCVDSVLTCLICLFVCFVSFLRVIWPLLTKKCSPT